MFTQRKLNKIIYFV